MQYIFPFPLSCLHWHVFRASVVDFPPSFFSLEEGIGIREGAATVFLPQKERTPLSHTVYWSRWGTTSVPTLDGWMRGWEGSGKTNSNSTLFPLSETALFVLSFIPHSQMRRNKRNTLFLLGQFPSSSCSSWERGWNPTPRSGKRGISWGPSLLPAHTNTPHFSRNKKKQVKQSVLAHFHEISRQQNQPTSNSSSSNSNNFYQYLTWWHAPTQHEGRK